MDETLPSTIEILGSWNLNLSLWLGLILLVAGYALIVGPVRRRKSLPPVYAGRQAAFYLGCFFAGLALVSPLDMLSDEYLLSAHMTQHLLLILVAAPLWLAGTPDWFVDQLMPGWLKALIRRLTRPVTAFLIFNGVLMAWHLPAWYDAALDHEALHILEHLCFLASAVIGWWPVLGPSHQAAPRSSLPVQMIYLFLCIFPNTGLAAIITLSPAPPYSFYLSAPRLWGLSVQDDQHIAGLIMWVPGMLVFFSALSVLFFRWFTHQPADEQGVNSPIGKGV